MTTVPEEAVNAAKEALKRMLYPVSFQGAEAALTAALPHLPLGVGVKKLEWRNVDAYCAWCYAKSPIGEYSVTWSMNESGQKLHYPDGTEKQFNGLGCRDAAKAAAQADYEDRILSSLEPSAARSLALEERLQAIEQQLVVNLGYFHDEKRILLETLQSHIISHISAIRALSSPDHADAGKVEGDGWLPIESAPKDGTEITARRSNRFKAFSCFFCHGEWLHYDHEDGLISYRPTEWKPFPQSSAPASEGAE